MSRTYSMRVVIHGHHPSDDMPEGHMTGKLIHRPKSLEELLELAGTQIQNTKTNCFSQNKGFIKI